MAVSTFGKRIRQFRVARGLSQVQLAERLKVSKNAVGNWQADRARPDIAKVPELCRILNIPLTAFFNEPPQGGQLATHDRKLLLQWHALNEHDRSLAQQLLDSMTVLQQQENPIHISDLRRVYLNSAVASAGYGNMLCDEAGEYLYIHVPLRTHVDELVAVSGNSMEPTLHHGDLLMIAHTQSLNPGEIGLFVINGSGYVKEYRPDGLHSHNPAYKTMHFEEETEVRCVGRVVGILQEEQLATTEEIQLMEEKKRSKRPIRHS